MRKVLRKSCNKLIISLVCGGSRIRTGDPMLAKHVLYQLSYTPLLWGSFCQSVRWTSFFSQSQPEGCSLLHHSSASSLPKITSKSLTKNAGLVAGIFGALATPPAGGRPGPCICAANTERRLGRGVLEGLPLVSFKVGPGRVELPTSTLSV